MNLHSVLVHANALVCLLLALRLMFFHKAGRYRFIMSLIAYLAILASAWIAFRIFYGKYTQVDPAEFFLNLTICIAVWRARGNISKLTGDKS
ncbi:phage holin family protein [Salmonella enterica subsp. enterica serovar Aba]|nr:phage holin family protein [Salmonella enterica]EBS2232010.1 phage holin family protein [Salmonella enterica subsp. enterica serovar Middlesbrough]EBX2183616.1 phage holin family protein [Salmonella enterica subsp. enterica serovar Aba]EBY6260728.1 phage holin family protein [Salmonella enterica subsp. enterica serovar Warnow]ECB3807417.1 phage holin family protein [Salmonella enterica subsp. enterica serovar Fufu]EJN2863915.1 phage holin family protein [Salmonella enterica subsp. enterica 